MKSSDDHTVCSDETLISLIAQSQEQALAQLYDRYYRLIFSIALAIVDDSDTAEEITLDVFMRVWQKAGTYRAEQAKASTWLTQIARHHAIDVLRRTARMHRFIVSWDETISHVESSGPNPEESAEIALRRERMRAALAQLPPEQRQALILAYFGGYTQSQIADLLVQPLGTIKTRLRLALRKVHEFLNQEEDAQDKSVAPQFTYQLNREE